MSVYTRTYERVRFDSTSSIMYINIIGHFGTDLISNDSEVPMVLPIDVNGNVPTGTVLNTLLTRFVLDAVPDSYLDNKLALFRHSEVVNANTVFSSTTDIEEGETDTVAPPAGYSIPVVIIPDRIKESTNTFTRSIIAPVGGISGVPQLTPAYPADPLTRIGQSTYMLIHTLVNGGALHNVHHSRNPGPSYPTASLTSTLEGLVASEYIISEYPNVYNQPNIVNLVSANGINQYQHFYYVDHEPLEIPVAYARAWFKYEV